LQADPAAEQVPGPNQSPAPAAIERLNHLKTHRLVKLSSPW